VTGGDPSRRLLAALHALEDVVRELPPGRKDAAVRLVVDRIRRLRGDGSRQRAAPECVERQLALEDILRRRAEEM
jgi:hypothetical protein